MRTSQGIITSSAHADATTNSLIFWRTDCGLSFHSIGMSASGTKSTTSARVRAPRPAATPSTAARPGVGTFQNRYATSTINATMKIVIVSDVTIASWTQRFAYTAAMPAAMMPVRSPPTSRPRNPHTTTVAVPSRHEAIMCAWKLSRPTSEYAARYSG